MIALSNLSLRPSKWVILKANIFYAQLELITIMLIETIATSLLLCAKKRRIKIPNSTRWTENGERDVTERGPKILVNRWLGIIIQNYKKPWLINTKPTTICTNGLL